MDKRAGMPHEKVKHEPKSPFLLHHNFSTDSYPEHWHNDVEIVMPIENTYLVHVNGQPHRLNEYDILIIPFGETHSLSAPKTKGQRLILQFGIDLFDRIGGLINTSFVYANPWLITPDNNPELHANVKSLLLEMFGEFLNRDSYFEIAVTNRIIEITLNLARNQQSVYGLQYESIIKRKEHIIKLIKCLEYINGNYNESLTLEATAQFIGFSKFYFTRWFRELTGLSFYDYLTRTRIKKVEAMLLGTSLSITEVAMETGFQNLTTFNRVFKKYKNCSPREFRYLRNVERETISTKDGMGAEDETLITAKPPAPVRAPVAACRVNPGGLLENPCVWADLPDPDIIRVGDVYYMVSTTMHFNPGIPVMKSLDLVHWEIVNYVYDILDDGDASALRGGENMYGKGSWAASLRERGGVYYVAFASYTTEKTYIFKTENIESGPWERYEINEVFHDPSLLFDDDGRVFLAYGSGTIRVVELTPDAQGVLPGGLNAVIIENADIGGEGGLPAEGSHFHKIDGKYFLFLIAWPASGSKRRVQLCYRSERIEGPYEGRVVLDDNMGYGQSGVAQGGIVDTPDGDWYAVLFQDRGAVGRVPVIVPLIWRDDWPILGTDGRAPMDVRMTLKPVADNLFAPDEFYPCHGTRDYSARNETGYLYKHFRRCSEREDGETEEELLTNNSFRDGLAGWETMEIAAIETETGDPPGGEPVLYVTGRKTTASGPRQIITGKTKHGGVYEVYARVKYDSGPIEKQFNICIRNGTDWQGIQIMASGMLTKGEWGEIKGAYTMPEDADMSETSVFIETIWAEKPNEKTDLMDFCVDSVSVIAKPLPKRTKTDAGENDVCAPGPAPWWQWNHNPDHNLWSLDERPGYLRLRTKYLNKGLLDARNTLTRRTFGPACAGVTALETDGMRNGDAAGLAAFQELYGFVGVKVINGEKYIVMADAASGEAAEVERFRLEQSRVYLRADFDFGDADEARFSYSLDGLNWKTIGGALNMQYKLSHFTGYRFALFYYATQIAGGYADFDYFRLSGETLRHDEALKILNVYIEGDEEIDGIKNCEAEVSICLDALPEGEYKGIYISALLPNILNVTGVEFCLDNIVGKPSFSVEGERLLMEVTGGAVYFSNNGSNLFAKLRLTCGQYATEDGEISLRVDYVHVDGGNVAYRVHDACARIKVKRVDTGAAAKLPGFANPLISHKYGADPWALEYGGRLYLYFTGDRYEYDEYGNLLENTYLKINTIGVISSSDLLNWTDHGEIAAAGVIGAAKWAEHSWAPAVAYKNIDGEDKFFLYFANDASNIGVLKADSPAGPWFDPIGKPLIHRGIKGIEDVAWCFDPAVLVDDDGEGYLYFGGGLPSETPEDALHPDTARVIKLGSDMISTAGEAVRIDAPAFFEDSGIHKYNGRYYYSYCSNFTGPHPAGYPGCGEIAYMTSDSPMGPFAFEDTLLKNPMDFFGVGGNNHHCIFAFKGEWYIAYHAQTLGKALGKQKGYRSPHINRLSYSSDGRIRPVKADMKGVTPIAAVNPYERVEAETFAWCAGISVSSSAPPDGERRTGLFVTHIHDGDWLAVANVDFGEKGASSLFAEVASPTGGKIEIRLDSPIAGEIIGTLAVGATGGEESWSLRQCALKPIKGVYDVFFVFRGDGEGELFNFGYWTVE